MKLYKWCIRWWENSQMDPRVPFPYQTTARGEAPGVLENWPLHYLPSKMPVRCGTEQVGRGCWYTKVGGKLCTVIVIYSSWSSLYAKGAHLLVLGHIQVHQRSGLGGFGQRAHHTYPGVWEDCLLNENAIASADCPVLVKAYVLHLCEMLPWMREWRCGRIVT